MNVITSGTYVLVLKELLTGITDTVPYANKHHAIARAIQEVQSRPVEATLYQCGQSPVWRLSPLDDDFTDAGKIGFTVGDRDVIDQDFWSEKGASE